MGGELTLMVTSPLPFPSLHFQRIDLFICARVGATITATNIELPFAAAVVLFPPPWGQEEGNK